MLHAAGQVLPAGAQVLPAGGFDPAVPVAEVPHAWLGVHQPHAVPAVHQPHAVPDEDPDQQELDQVEHPSELAGQAGQAEHCLQQQPDPQSEQLMQQQMMHQTEQLPHQLLLE